MSDLAVPEAPANSPAVQADQPAAPQQMTELMLWAESARQAAQIAQSLAKTSFAGQFRGKPEEITAVILSGQELGLQPMASLKAIDVIQGSPALRAHAMRGLVQSHGHDVELLESTETHCVMRGRRKGKEAWQEVRWDIPRAQKLGLLSKDQWKKQPQTMLIARATGEVCRLIASDVLHGMPYAVEELDSSSAKVLRGAPEEARQPLSVAALTAAPAPALSTAVDPWGAQPEDQPTVGTSDPWADQPIGDDDVQSDGWPETAQPGGGAS
ncbi:hypothetical protein LHJ74_14445 [Streptomyces sp. N2-109]|uniref:Uncharacterized protein n=1 Tax=Streptomyces gossypii TaxID=2883101 RepID=A0ABT2JTS7_9ACTN|nr:hypothetical protein [Streptomyces gossypii]MCT2591093.1 hypothetical protein [Streptomyces gossypii]